MHYKKNTLCLLCAGHFVWPTTFADLQVYLTMLQGGGDCLATRDRAREQLWEKLPIFFTHWLREQDRAGPLPGQQHACVLHGCMLVVAPCRRFGAAQ